MTLSPEDEALISPIGSGDGHCFYDFSTMYISVDRYPFVSDPSRRLLLPRRITNFLHEIIHFYQHLCTTTGLFQAICRHKRISFALEGLECGSIDAIRTTAFPSRSERHPLLNLATLADIRQLKRDPLAPNVHYPFRLYWGQLWFGEHGFIKASSPSCVRNKSSLHDIAFSLLSFDSFFRTELDPDAYAGRKAINYGSVLSAGVSRLQYQDGHYKRNIDTISIIETFCSIYEIATLYSISPELADIRFQDAHKSDYLVAARYALWALKKDFLPANIYNLLPELLLIAEISLNPPMPPYLDDDKHFSWVDIYPPCRFDRLVQASARVGGELRWERFYTQGELNNRSTTLCSDAGIKTGDVNRHTQAARTASKLPAYMALNLKDNKDFQQFRWLEWYFWLQGHLFENVLSGGKSITEFLLNDLFDEAIRDRDDLWEPPVCIHGGNNGLSPYLRHNMVGALSFGLENLSTYMLHDLMIGSGPVNPLPFNIGEDIFCDRWNLVGRGDVARMVDYRLGRR